MATVKKYNQNSNLWEIISTSDASSVSVGSSELFENNVESVLLDHDKKIKKLEGNVAWLAKYGGGGSGSGGGSNITGTIKVSSGNQVALTGGTLTLEDSLVVDVLSSSLLTDWEITAIVGNSIVSSGVNKITITKEELAKRGITKTFGLTILAIDDTASQASWVGTILISNVKISSNSLMSILRKLLEASYITLNYEVGIAGYYDVYVNNLKLKSFELTNLSGILLLYLSDIQQLLMSDNTTWDYIDGTNIFTIKLVKTDDPNIGSSTINYSVIVASSTPIIYSDNLSSDINSPTNFIVTQDVPYIGVFNFTVYYSNITSYNVGILIDKEPNSINDIKWSSKAYSYNVKQTISESINTSEEDINNKHILYLCIKTSSTSFVYEKFYYDLSKSANNLLPYDKESLIFEFIPRNLNFTSGRVISEKSVEEEHPVLTIYNQNSKNYDTSTKALRFLNSSYATITHPEYLNQVINKVVTRDFTLELCYKSDYHPDDDRTLLLFGTVTDGGNTISRGIFIRAHKLHIFSASIDLQDKELTHIAITGKAKDSESAMKIIVYIDGVVEGAYDINPNDIFGKLEGSKFNIYLAGEEYNNKISKFSDFNIYGIRLYNKCLSPYEVIFDKLNDFTRANSVGDLLDYAQIMDGLKRNFIDIDDKGNINSFLWDSNINFDQNSTNYSSNYDLSKLVSISTSEFKISDNIINYTVPIPIMALNMGTSLTWDEFTSNTSSWGPIKDVPFSYYDQNSDKTKIIEGTLAEVSVQGTSTKGNYIKNLNIEIKDGHVFIPKETWFPEQIYTLKADVVDSSHSINTATGKFVNELLGMSYDSNGIATKDNWYQYSPTILESFLKLNRDPNSAIRTVFPKATLKHGVEGFPIFLICNFTNKGKIEAKSLGIYLFILGRNSPRNLGYEIITNATINGKSAEKPQSYPYYGEMNISSNKNEGYWIEAEKNESFSNSLQFLNLDSLENAKLTGPFWQSDSKEYYNDLMQIKYSNADNAVLNGSVMDFEPFSKFVKNVAKLPVTNKHYSTSGGIARNTFFNTRYPKYSWNNSVWYPVKGAYELLVNKGDDLQSILGDLELDNYARYMAIILFLGLVDNLLKNMPIKFIKNNSGIWETPLLGIYDTDTGLGGDNQAALSVKPNVWLSDIENKELGFEEVPLLDSNSNTYVATANKLWYFDSDAINYDAGKSNESGSWFASAWFSLCAKMVGIDNINNTDAIADKFIDEYFIPLTAGCGELLFNLTYFVKYIDKYTSELLSLLANLHGRRIKQARNWLRKRVKFLHSIFEAFKPNDNIVAPVSSSINISSGSYPKFNLLVKSPVLIKVTDLGSSTYYYNLEDNIDQVVYWGSLEGTGTPVAHQINQADIILKLGLKDINFQRITSGFVPNLIEFNVSGDKQISNDNNPLNAFKITENGKLKSELRLIDLSYTSASNVTNYPLDLSNGFTKLDLLNLASSCITSLNLPNDLNLKTLDLTGSTISNLTLENLNLLGELKISNCKKLNSLTIQNCALLTNIKIDNTLTSLLTLNIANSTLKSITITNNNVSDISLQSDALESIEITSAEKLKNLNIEAPNLKTLELNNCNILEKLKLSGENTLTTLKINKCYSLETTCSNFNNNNYDSSIDLYNFRVLTSVSFLNCSKILYILFRNDKNNPVKLTSRFTNCINLTRIYGAWSLNAPELFSGLTNFKIIGDTYGDVKYKDSDVIKHPIELGIVKDDGVCKFLEGKGQTNIIGSDTTNIYSCFSNTSCGVFDFYYLLQLLKTNVSYNLNSLFYKTIRDSLVDKFTWENSPSKYTFNKCKSVTSISGIFYGCCNGAIKLYSPTHDSNNALKDDGLFSPLKSVTSFSLTFYGGRLYCDRFVYRRASGQYAITDLYHEHIYLVVDDINTFDYSNLSDINWIVNNIDKLGNMDYMFLDMPKLKNITLFANNLKYIDFSHMNLCVPYEATHIYTSFIGEYGLHEFNLNTILREPTSGKESKLQRLASSFSVTSSNPFGDSLAKDWANMKYDVDTFKYFPHLNWIGLTGDKLWENMGESGNPDLRSTVSTFLGLNKKGPYPENILQNLKDLLVVDGLFMDFKLEDANEVSLPGNLFKNNRELRAATRVFLNFLGKFKLTSNSFENCPLLLDVRSLFKDCKSNIIGCIPARLLYHGATETTITKTYANVNDYNPVEKLIKDGKVVQRGVNEEDIHTITITYLDVNRNINNVNYLFSGSFIEAYSNENPTVENNPNYLPGNYILIGGSWQETTPDFNEKTDIWEYDGVSHPANYEGEILDSPRDVAEVTVKTGADGSNVANILNYCAPPDLLRYCSSGILELIGVFKNCGTSTQSNYDSKDADKGLKGRICPYMFKNTPNITSVKLLFLNCKHLSRYQVNGMNYLIPTDLFKYAPQVNNLQEMFAGCILVPNSDLSVFGHLTSMGINVIGLFRNSYYVDDVNISNVFVDCSIGNASFVFTVNGRVNDLSGDLINLTIVNAADIQALLKDGKVTFGINFKTNFSPLNTYYAYDGFTLATFDDNKQLYINDVDGHNNYRKG